MAERIWCNLLNYCLLDSVDTEKIHTMCNGFKKKKQATRPSKKPPVSMSHSTIIPFNSLYTDNLISLIKQIAKKMENFSF